MKIPREIIYNKIFTDKRVIIFSYLCARRSFDDTVAFSTTELCHWSKMKPNYRPGKINQKYYETLLSLSRSGYFLQYPDFTKKIIEKTNSEKYQLVTLNAKKFDVSNNYGIIYADELEKILNFKQELSMSDIELSRMSSAYILLLLAYIRVNINRSKDKPMCCYRHFKTISEETGLSERYIGRIIDILDELKILKCQQMKREHYIENGKKKYITTPKIFADYRHFIFDENGNQSIDLNYNPNEEIQKQIIFLSEVENK